MVRLLPSVALAVCTCCGVGPAADEARPKDKAQAAAVAFAKAVNARDVDAMTEVAGLPYYFAPGGKGTVFEKAEGLKADLKRWARRLPADCRVPEAVVEVRTWDDFPKNFEADDPEVKLARQVLGKDGYVVYLGAEGRAGAVVLVAIRAGGGARVVGLPLCSPPESVRPVVHWMGTVPDLGKLKAGPEPVYTNATKDATKASITDRAALNRLWVAWRPGEDPPQVNFDTHFVVIATLRGGRTSIQHLTVYPGWGSHTLGSAAVDGRAGFGYAIAVFPRAGVEAFFGQPLGGR